MKLDVSLKTDLRYGRRLAEFAVSGLRCGRDSSLNGQPLSTVLSQSARESLSLAAIGAFGSLLPYCLRHRQVPISKAIAGGVMAGAIG